MNSPSSIVCSDKKNFYFHILTQSSKAAKGEEERLERKQLGMSRFAQSCQIGIKQASEEY